MCNGMVHCCHNFAEILLDLLERSKEEAYEGGFHFRPVYSSTKMCYVAHIYHKDLVKTYKKMDLYHDIACLCKAGITISED